MSLPDGRVCYVHAEAEVIKNYDGVPIHLEGTIQDITERKKIEMEREQYFIFFKTSSDLMCIADPNGAFMKTNPACSDTLGYSAEELLSRPFIEFVHPDDKQKTLDEMARQQEIGNSFEFENRYMCSDGSSRWLSWRAAYNDCEKITYATARDISERKRTEEALKKSNGLYHSLVETSQDLIWRCDSEGRYTYLNLAWEQIFGYELDEMLGKKFSDFQLPEFAERDFITFNNIMADGSLSGYETVHLGKSGNEIHLVFNALATYDNDGNVDGASGTAYDITQRKLTEIDLRQAKIAAEAASTAKSEFLANMSHEIRTPLNCVFGNAQLLEMTDLTADQRECVADLMASGKDLLYLINNILDLSKIEAGAIELESAEFSLYECIQEIIKMQKVAAFNKGLVLVADVHFDATQRFAGDQLRIKQILLNLIGNAIKFTAEGRITVSVLLLERRDAVVMVELTVRDSGIGIAPNALENIFNPFVQEDGSTTRRYGGTGLGLSICRRLTDLMGGTIFVESTPGVGSSFTVTIPLLIVPQMATPEEPTQRSAVNWDGPPLRILLVEDDQTNVKLGSALLSRLGHNVVGAGNGRECLDALERETFDVVLMDIQMPVMNGEDALFEIRRRESGTSSHQRVIALTAYSLRGESEHFIDLGFDGHVSKPMEIKELVSAMKLVMDVAEKNGHDALEGNRG